MARNVKVVCITIPNEIILKKITTTPALKNLSKLAKQEVLKVGDNIERVNHFQFSELMRVYPIAGCTVMEITNP